MKSYSCKIRCVINLFFYFSPRLTSTSNSVKGVTHIFLNIGSQAKNQIIDLDSTHSPGGAHTPNVLRRLDSKPNERITILSNVKVDQAKTDNANTPPVLKNATSTPMMQMQTIHINGTPAYKATPQIYPRCSFTKDEIMAMPTIILVPTTGKSKQYDLHKELYLYPYICDFEVLIVKVYFSPFTNSA